MEKGSKLVVPQGPGVGPLHLKEKGKQTTKPSNKPLFLREDWKLSWAKIIRGHYAGEDQDHRDQWIQSLGKNEVGTGSKRSCFPYLHPCNQSSEHQVTSSLLLEKGDKLRWILFEWQEHRRSKVDL